MIDHLVSQDATGIYNCCNTGTLTPYEIATHVRDYLSPKMKVTKVSYSDLLEKLPNRRVNTILSTQKLEDSGYSPRSALDALTWCLQNYE
jgi:dTDP-4-dehydrorhamnose reductase